MLVVAKPIMTSVHTMQLVFHSTRVPLSVFPWASCIVIMEVVGEGGGEKRMELRYGEKERRV